MAATPASSKRVIDDVKYERLSYDLSKTTPYPDGLWPVEIEHKFDMAEGAESNVFRLRLCNHVGTHIDGPNHFGKDKPPLNSFSIDHFIFDHPRLVQIPKSDGEIILADDLSRIADSISGCDLLMMRTGFGAVRANDLERYRSESPGFSAEAAQYVVDKLPHVRALAIDSISFACPQQMAEGIEAHQILLDKCQRPIFLIEDLNLEIDLQGLKQVIVSPLFGERLDSAPCTIIALQED